MLVPVKIPETAQRVLFPSNSLFPADFAAKNLRIAPDLNEFHSDSSKHVLASIAQFGDVLGFVGPF